MKSPSWKLATKLLAVGICLLPCLSGRAMAAVLVNETFADGSRGPTGNQNPPTSLNWFASGATSTLTATPGSMTGISQATAYFTAAGSPISLADGQTLTLSITFIPTFTSLATGNDIRFGLYDSNSSRISADGLGVAPSSNVFTPYTGYMASTGTRLEIYERNSPGSANLINSISGSYTQLKTGANLTLVSGTAYTFTFTLERSGSDMTLTSALTGGSLSGRTTSVVDSTSIWTTFDTIALYGATDVTSMTYTSINLSVVPEPGTASLVFLAGCSMFLVLRKRSRLNVQV